MRRIACRPLLGAALFLVAMCVADVSFGQGGYRSYGGRYRSPYGPTITPYLDYFRRDTGVLDPYNTFIRPRRQLENQIGQIVQQERAENTRLQQQIQRVREEQVAPTGAGATFMNYSHYYRQGPATVGTRRR